MHIFITGMAGFLGANLADYYVSKKFKVGANYKLLHKMIRKVKGTGQHIFMRWKIL